MESKVEILSHSRVRIAFTAKASDLTHALRHALEHTTAQVAVKGFRPGKAPKHLLVGQVGKGRILSELVDHALPELLEDVVKKENLTLIEAPAYTLDKLCELNDDGSIKLDSVLKFTAEADIAPQAKVGDYHKIKIKPSNIEKVTEAVVDDVLNQLQEQQASFVPVERAAKQGDRVEIDFAGKRGGIPEERLASTHYPIVLGSKVMIPGFEDELIGKKASDHHTFEVTFPKEYHAKDLAGEKVIFDVTLHKVEEKKLPELDAVFAKSFDHKTIEDLKKAIRQERELHFAEQAKQKDEEAVLEAFIKLVDVDVPKSLIENEVDRQMDTLREQTKIYGLTFDHYLEHLKKTEEELRKEMLPTAQKAVTIGLGLGEVVKQEKLPQDKNAGFLAIEKLVEMATTPAQSKPVKS